MTLNHTINGILQSLGWAILHSFWQMALLWLTYFLFFGWHRRFSPVARHNAALAFLAAGTIWFIGTFSNEYTKFMQVGRYLTMIPETASASEAIETGSWSGLNEWLRRFMERNIAWLSAAYLLLTTLTAWKLVFSLWMVRLLKTRGIQPVGTDVSILADSLARQLQIQWKVRTFISERVDVPATFGFLKPVILLPAAALAQLTPEQLETVLLHELAHIRRADYLVNILVSIMETVLVHNPFAWLLARSVRTERELCCDDIVLSRNRDILSYASALLALEKNRMIPQPAMAMASNGKKGQLFIRIQRMLDPGKNHASGAHRLMGIVLMGLICILMAWAVPGKTVAETRIKKMPEIPFSSAAQVTQPAKAPFVVRQEKIILEKRNSPVAKEKHLRKEFEELAAPEVLGWESPFTAEAPEPPMPGSPQAFDFSFRMPDAGTVPRQEPVELRELRMLMEGRQREKTTQTETREKQVQFLDEVIARNEAMNQDILLRAREQEWETMAERMKILQQQELINGRKLSELAGKYSAPFIIYHNEGEKSMAPVGARKSRTKVQASPAKIQRIKTRDGYILRIETGVEAIDIRIAEGDQVVEGTTDH